MIFRRRNINTVLIGTCRIKKMISYIEDPILKKRIVQVSTHVHYAEEIKQVIGYLQGNPLEQNLLGLIIDDINAGNLNSYHEIEAWKKKTALYLKNSKKVIIEISSIKEFLLKKNPKHFGNITALSNIIGRNNRLADFIPADKLKESFSDIKPIFSKEEDIIRLMKEIKALLPKKDILWMSHFRFYMDEKGKEIEERKKLGNWVANGAKQLGDDYFDQTAIVDILGVKKALIDSSHYSMDAERLMANIISSWAINSKVP